MGKHIDRTGETFGSLTVLREAEPTFTKSGVKLSRWVCKCSCGNVITVFTSNLTSGHTTKCRRCSMKSFIGNRKTHGMRHTRLYSIWACMKTRCYNPNSKAYERYGALGITMCDEWLGEKGFENFAKWANENGYVEDSDRGENTIDRIDPSKGYYPENCRFANAYVQANNRMFCITFTDTDGETLTMKQLARKYDISYGTMHTRWSRGKRTIEDITKMTVGNSNKRVAHFVEYGKEFAD